MKVKAILGTVKYTLTKFSPEILLGVGITGVVGSTILACKATLSVEAVLDEHAEQLAKIEEGAALAEKNLVDYPIKKEKSDRRILMCATTGRFIRLYGPSATLMMASIGCILGAHHIMKKRNLALMAAYKLMEEAFSKYRKRVVDELGENADAHFYYGSERVEGETRTVTDADGNETELSPVLNHLSGFSRFFEEDKPDQMGGWTGSDDAELSDEDDHHELFVEHVLFSYHQWHRSFLFLPHSEGEAAE